MKAPLRFLARRARDLALVLALGALVGWVGGVQYPTNVIVLSLAQSLGTTVGNTATLTTTGGLSTNANAPPQIKICPTPCGGANTWDASQIAVTPVSATQATLTVVTSPNGPLAAGTYDVIVENPGGGRGDSKSFLITTSTATPATTHGAHLKAWWKIDAGLLCTGSVACSGTTNILSWTDQSGSLACGGAACVLGSSGTKFPAYNANSGHWGLNGGTEVRSMTCDGTDDDLTVSNLTIGTATHQVWMVYRPLANSATTRIGYGFNSVETARWRSATSYAALSGTEGTGNTTVAIGANTVDLVTKIGWASAAGTTTFTNTGNNLAATAGTAAGTVISTAGAVHLCTSDGTTSPANMELVEVWITDNASNSTQDLANQSYVQSKYGVEGQLTSTTTLASAPTGITNIVGGSSGRTLRALGGGYNSSATFAVPDPANPGSFLGSPTAAIFSSSVLDVAAMPSLTAGTAYDYVIKTTNNGQAITVHGGLTPKSLASFDAMAAAGTKVIGWFDPHQSAVTSGTVTSVQDLSGLNNPIAQATGGSQFTYTASDAVCNTHDSWSGNSKSMSGAMAFDTATPALMTLIAFKSTVNSGTRNLSNYLTSNNQLKQVDVTSLTWHTTTTDVAFTGSIYNALHSFYGYTAAGANPAIAANVDFGTEATASSTNSAMTNNGTFLIGNGSIGTYCMVVAYNAALTAQEKIDTHTWLAALVGVP